MPTTIYTEKSLPLCSCVIYKKEDSIKKIIKDYPNDLKCRFCDKECKNKNSFVNH